MLLDSFHESRVLTQLVDVVGLVVLARPTLDGGLVRVDNTNDGVLVGVSVN